MDKNDGIAYIVEWPIPDLEFRVNIKECIEGLLKLFREQYGNQEARILSITVGNKELERLSLNIEGYDTIISYAKHVNYGRMLVVFLIPWRPSCPAE